MVELVETREESVINKQARVQRTETISDKIKRAEVRVEDERGRGAAQPARKAG
jgi:hypothetical protein